jgi:hypothetical protein
MAARVRSVVTVSQWKETTLDVAAEDLKLTHATARSGFSGAIEGEGFVTYIMTYTPAGDVLFKGLERVTARVPKGEGSFVLEYRGRYTEDGLHADAFVVVGSGTGELRWLAGAGQYIWPVGEMTGVLEMEFD